MLQNALERASVAAATSRACLETLADAAGSDTVRVFASHPTQQGISR